ncbi:MAG: SBBP repeat-containing protein [Candidatus Zixiibacteriota bacterium]
MKILTLLVILLVLLIPVITTASDIDRDGRAQKNLTGTPLSFTPNQGQWEQPALYRCDAPGAVIWLTPEAAYYCFNRRIADGDNISPDQHHSRSVAPVQIEYLLVKTEFVDASRENVFSGTGDPSFYSNYFLGQNPSRWRTDVPAYNTVTCRNLYPGIDLTYYSRDGLVEYDFTVAPGANPAQVKIRFVGIENLRINDAGELEISTAWGTVIERNPLSYQTVNEQPQTIASRYVISGDNTVSFELTDQYDPTLPLVIDPVQVYGTYLGGSIEDWGFDIAVDPDSNMYITGLTYSVDFPTENALCDTITSSSDAYITKIKYTGDSVFYSTYIGGNGVDFGLGIEVGPDGSCFLTGVTYSTDFPLADAYQTTYESLGDAFVTRLNDTGDSLIYSTYLGGSAYDGGEDITVDSNLNAYITGGTDSYNFPTASPLYENQLNRDVFITKITPDGSSLLFSSYLGGTESDFAKALALDTDTNIYLFGATNSDNFPIFNAFWNVRVGGYDAFCAKISFDYLSLEYSTYLGGSDDDWAADIKVDSGGQAYLTGYTTSLDYHRRYAYQVANKGLSDAFITLLNANGNDLIFSTYFGGSDNDFSQGLVIDDDSRVVITGSTSSSDFPLKREMMSYQGEGDAFIVKFGTGGANLIFSTFLGGTGSDGASSIDIDAGHNIYLTGSTSSTDFPTQAPLVDTLNGVKDVFIARIFDDCIDDDFDDVCDNEDNCIGVYNPTQGDADGDDIGDACDECTDTDGDTFGNPGYSANTCATDNCPDIFNSDQEDADGDGIGDSCDVCLNDPDNDIDGDGLCGDIDNCPNNFNPFQFNSDGDDHGDSCDNCPGIINNDQTDSDSDGIGDSCDICPLDGYNDIDTDGVCGDIDNCPFFYNPDQLDADSNGIGDACESCCVGETGNANCSASETPDISDITRLIDYLYLTHTPLCCPEEADANGSGGPEPDISDITKLIDFLYLSHNPLPACP